MRLLFLTQVLPYPLDAGPKARAYFVLRYLAQHHEVTLLTFVRPSDREDSVAHLRSLCAAVHTVPMLRSTGRDLQHLVRSLGSPTPFLIGRDWVAEMAETALRLVKETPFAAIHADQLPMAQYALWARDQLPQSSTPRPNVVLDEHNAVYLIFQRLAATERNPLKRAVLELEWRKLQRYEDEICRRMDKVVWVTQQDWQALHPGVAPTADEPSVIPICVDPEGEMPLAPAARPRRVTFLGGLHYPPNAQGILWFAEHVFPIVLAKVPDAVLTVIGKQPPPGLHKLNIPAANLEVTGYVDDPMPYLRETAAFLVPLFAAGGMRVKILDAWMWGLPIVSTTIGAEGIEIRPGENIFIADEAPSFAAAVLTLLQDDTARARLAHSGRRWLEQAYNWRTIYQAWDKHYPRMQSDEDPVYRALHAEPDPRPAL